MSAGTDVAGGAALDQLGYGQHDAADDRDPAGRGHGRAAGIVLEPAHDVDAPGLQSDQYRRTPPPPAAWW